MGKRRAWKSHRELPPAPSRHLHRELAKAIRGLPNVLGTYLGHKIRAGRHLRRPALVVLVSAKVPTKQLKAAHRIPPEVSVQVTPTFELRLPTDVVLHEKFTRAAGAAPGDPTEPSPGGTVGVAISHPEFGDVVTTAGHVYSTLFPIYQEWPLDAAPKVALRDRDTGGLIQGQLRKLVVNTTMDYALVSPATAASNNVYDGQLIGGIHVPDHNDITQSCSALEKDGSHATVFRGVDYPVQFDDGSSLQHAIVTDICTSGGDSGCVLIDDNRRVVGLLVGHTPAYSAFMSIDHLLSNEHASLL